jgi:hypothetical protein
MVFRFGKFACLHFNYYLLYFFMYHTWIAGREIISTFGNLAPPEFPLLLCTQSTCQPIQVLKFVLCNSSSTLDPQFRHQISSCYAWLTFRLLPFQILYIPSPLLLLVWVYLALEGDISYVNVALFWVVLHGCL